MSGVGLRVAVIRCTYKLEDSFVGATGPYAALEGATGLIRSLSNRKARFFLCSRPVLSLEFLPLCT